MQMADPTTPSMQHSEPKTDQKNYRKMWIMAVGWLTALPQPVTWHLEKGLVFCADFLAFERDRFSAHSPQYT